MKRTLFELTWSIVTKNSLAETLWIRKIVSIGYTNDFQLDTKLDGTIVGKWSQVWLTRMEESCFWTGLKKLRTALEDHDISWNLLDMFIHKLTDTYRMLTYSRVANQSQGSQGVWLFIFGWLKWKFESALQDRSVLTKRVPYFGQIKGYDTFGNVSTTLAEW